MLAKLLSREGGQITVRGQKVSDTIDAVIFYAVILLVFGIVGSIETGRWFG
jgi:hypothetical protein